MGMIITGKAKSRHTFLYLTTTPAGNLVSVNTGVTVADMARFARVSLSMVVQYQVDGSKYILYNGASGASISDPNFYDIAVLESKEFILGIGDVVLTFWIDSTTETVWYRYDFDGVQYDFLSMAIQGLDYVI